jgi:hypothetical protein
MSKKKILVSRKIDVSVSSLSPTVHVLKRVEQGLQLPKKISLDALAYTRCSTKEMIGNPPHAPSQMAIRR